MSDPTSPEQIEKHLRTGRKNQQVAAKVTNWCQHARVERMGGGGLIEQIYDVPIGHAGIRCAHAPAGGMMCWNLEDAFLEHYESHCVGCEKRNPGTGETMQPEIDAFEEEKASRKVTEQAEKREEQDAFEKRRAERSLVFDPSDPAQTDLAELFDALDQKSDKAKSERLVELATIAPDVFTSKIKSYLGKQVSHDDGRFRSTAADILLTLPGEEQEKLEVALTVCNYGVSDIVVDFIEKNASLVTIGQVKNIIGPLAYRATSFRSMGGKPRPKNVKPLLSLVQVHPDEVGNVLGRLLGANEEHNVDLAACIVVVITSKYPDIVKPHSRALFAKLLRRKHLLPKYDDNGFDDKLSRLRKAAACLFEVDPENSDTLLKSLVEGDRTAKKELGEIYCHLLKTSWQGPIIEASLARKIAFKRLIWMAVDQVEDVGYHPATNFFSGTRNALVEVAASEIDVLFGAAAMLSETDRGQDDDNLVQRIASPLAGLERSNIKRQIDNLQGAFVQWVFMVAKQEDGQGIKRVLDLYVKLPKTEVQFRSNIVAHMTELIGDAGSMNAVLPHLYSALTDPEPLVRGSAATAIGEASFEIRRDFPDLIYEVYLALLTDPNIYVHQSAVRALKTYSFPSHVKPQLGAALFSLVKAYYHDTGRASFLVQCLEEFVDAFLTDSALSGDWGKVIVHIIGSMPDYEACQTIERLSVTMVKAPGYTQLVAGLLSGEDVREFMRGKLLRVLFYATPAQLAECVEPIVADALCMVEHRPWKLRTNFALLARAGAFDRIAMVCDELLESLPDTEEQKSLRLLFRSIGQVGRFEASLPQTERELQRIETVWNDHIKELKREKEADDARRRLPSSLFRKA